MLFPYTYVPHKMEKMQAFIDFIFHDVWCKAPVNGSFGLHLFNANTELREVMEAFYYSDAQGAYFFYGHVERIYGLFSALTTAQIIEFQQWYRANNDLEKVCGNDPATHLVRYADIAVIHNALGEQLAVFFKGLYSQSLLNLVALRAKIGDVGDHYQTFVSTNNAGKCPFCGIFDIKGAYHSKRDAYDHYLPKALYPFNSINFRNLAPACHVCNSTYKLSKDPAHDSAGQRRKAFNPYTLANHTIELQVTLQHSALDKLKPADISLQFGPAAIKEEIDTWRDLYGIDEQYKGKFCSNDALDWLEQVRTLHRDHNVTPSAQLAILSKQMQQSPVANCNFLKHPFLTACQQIGILDVLKNSV